MLTKEGNTLKPEESKQPAKEETKDQMGQSFYRKEGLDYLYF